MTARNLALMIAALVGAGLLLFFFRSPGSQVRNTRREAASTAAGDPYRIPDGPPERLVQFIRELNEYRFEDPNTDSAQEHVRKTLALQAEVGQRLLGGTDVGGALRVTGARMRLTALTAQWQDAESLAQPKPGRSPDPEAQTLAAQTRANLVTEAQKLAEDESPEIRGEARLALVREEFDRLDPRQADTAAALAKKLGDAIEARPIDQRLWELAANLSSVLAYADHYQLAIDAMNRYADLMQNSGVDEGPLSARQMRDQAKKLELIGQPFALEGTLLDGTTLDWEQYQGKVVLVDFWATWCGPCLEEIPNVRRVYDELHDRGFEVIGVCLDDYENKAAVEAAVGTRFSLPWATLFSAGPDSGGLEHPMAKRYDVNFLPTCILIDKEGKVATPLARGGRLRLQVARLLGLKLEDLDKALEAQPHDHDHAGHDPGHDGHEHAGHEHGHGAPAAPRVKKAAPGPAPSPQPEPSASEP